MKCHLFAIALVSLFAASAFGQITRAYGKSIDLGHNTPDFSGASCVDAAGNLYVSALASPVNGDSTRLFVLKFDPYGILVWSWNSLFACPDPPNGIAVDGAGNVYIAGIAYSDSAQQNADVLTVKLYSDGTPAWYRLTDGPWHKLDNATAITVDSNNIVHVAGNFSDSQGILFNGGSISFDSSGNIQTPLTVFNSVVPNDTLLTGTGMTLVAGADANDSNGAYQILDSTGNLVKGEVFTNSGPDSYSCRGSVDHFGNFYVLTSHHHSNGSSSTDGYTVKCLNPSGQVLWTSVEAPGIAASIAAGDVHHAYIIEAESGTTYLRSIGSNLTGTAVVQNYKVLATNGAMSTNGSSVLLTVSEGTSGSQADPPRFVLNSYDASGNVAWAQTYQLAGGGAYGSGLVGAGAAAYAVGQVGLFGHPEDILVLKYVTGLAISAVGMGAGPFAGGGQVPVSVSLNGAAAAGGFPVQLSSNYPGVVGVQSSVTVPQGATYAKFTVFTNPVDADTSVTISARANGVYRWASAIIATATLSSLALSANPVKGGTSLTGTVTLTSAAGLSGKTIAVSSSNSVAKVPVSVTVGSGGTTAQFQITTAAVSAITTTQIVVRLGTVSKSFQLTVIP